MSSMMICNNNQLLLLHKETPTLIWSLYWYCVIQIAHCYCVINVIMDSTRFSEKRSARENNQRASRDIIGLRCV